MFEQQSNKATKLRPLQVNPVHPEVVGRPNDGKSAGKPDAVQTLRASRCPTPFAKRLDCGELAPAFTAGLPTAVNTASADEPLLSPLK